MPTSRVKWFFLTNMVTSSTTYWTSKSSWTPPTLSLSLLSRLWDYSAVFATCQRRIWANSIANKSRAWWKASCAVILRPNRYKPRCGSALLISHPSSKTLPIWMSTPKRCFIRLSIGTCWARHTTMIRPDQVAGHPKGKHKRTDNEAFSHIDKLYFKFDFSFSTKQIAKIYIKTKLLIRISCFGWPSFKVGQAPLGRCSPYFSSRNIKKQTLRIDWLQLNSSHIQSFIA